MSSIPSGMRSAARWVNFKHLSGKKPPVDAKGRPLSKWDDPANWLAFDEAVSRFKASDDIDGIGFVLGDGWSGIDLDHCRDVESGALKPQAEAILALCQGAYAEVSPSGEGVKVFGRGGPWLEIEMADVSKIRASRKPTGYFCVTGQRLGDDRTQTPDLPLDVIEAYFSNPTTPNATPGLSTQLPEQRDRPLPKEGAQVPPGSQGDAMFREAAALRGRGYSVDEIEETLWGLRARFPSEEGAEPWTRGDIRTIARSAGRYEPGDKVSKADVPNIVLSEDLVGIIDECSSAVSKCPGLTVYVRAQTLVTITRDGSDPKMWKERPPGQPSIKPMSKPLCREALARSAVFLRYKQGVPKEVMPPAWISEQLLARTSWPIPYLEAITETPVFLRSGRVLNEPGHDRESGILFDPLDGIEWPELVEAPTLEDAKAAGKVLLEPVSDFPFVALSDVGAYIAAILSLVGRIAIEGAVPMFPIRAKAPGSGKSLLASVISIIGTGREAASMTWADSEEMRKRVTSIAIAGTPLVLLDNLTGSLGSDVLASAITSTTWEDRVLGVSENVSIPLRTIWIATGNNLGFHRTLGRRVIPIDLDAKMEHPEDRTQFKIPELIRWTLANRPRLVGAALTILRAFHVAGRPRHGSPRMGSFEAWDDLVRGAVVWSMSAKADPAGSGDESSARGRIRAVADDDLTDIRTLYAALRKRFENAMFTAAEVWDRADSDRRLKQVLDSVCPTRGGRPATLASFRYRVRAIEGRPVGDYTLRRAAGGGKAEAFYAILQDDETPTPWVAPPGDSGEGF